MVEQAPNALVRFPAASRHTANCNRGSPPRWPVSGLTETTRDAFPVGIARRDAVPVALCHEPETELGSVRLPLRGQLRLGAGG